jgi:nitroreductase
MDTINTLKERRSINFFDPDKTIPEEKINEIIELASLAPSA